mmetsp:Transcript_5463/g.17233  ORF Transcript_5463/g.17233 Transcript_5463/m.17233 type:complete len:100 (+) Transcript_5463:2516-2815(+)
MIPHLSHARARHLASTGTSEAKTTRHDYASVANKNDEPNAPAPRLTIPCAPLEHVYVVVSRAGERHGRLLDLFFSFDPSLPRECLRLLVFLCVAGCKLE